MREVVMATSGSGTRGKVLANDNHKLDVKGGANAIGASRARILVPFVPEMIKKQGLLRSGPPFAWAAAWAQP